MRTVSRLRLLCFLLFTSLLMCCPFRYLLPCRIYFRPNKVYYHLRYVLKFIQTATTSFIIYFGGPGGICARVQDVFLFTSYSNNLCHARQKKTDVIPIHSIENTISIPHTTWYTYSSDDSDI